jgi:hypothetical protein
MMPYKTAPVRERMKRSVMEIQKAKRAQEFEACGAIACWMWRVGMDMDGLDTKGNRKKSLNLQKEELNADINTACTSFAACAV